MLVLPNRCGRHKTLRQDHNLHEYTYCTPAYNHFHISPLDKLKKEVGYRSMFIIIRSRQKPKFWWTINIFVNMEKDNNLHNLTSLPMLLSFQLDIFHRTFAFLKTESILFGKEGNRFLVLRNMFPDCMELKEISFIIRCLFVYLRI